MSLILSRQPDRAEAQLERAWALRERVSQLEVETGQASPPLHAENDHPENEHSANEHPETEESTSEQAHWTNMVQDILARIERGECTKVVAALRQQLSFAQALRLPATLRALSDSRLSKDSPAVTFAFKRGTTAFCGASPERLVHKHGVTVRSEALAGTFRYLDGSFAQELLRSPKEHQEHAPVLRAIVEALHPVCSELQYSPQPEICELPHLLHLKSPVQGTLKQPLHILQLLERLHPTPAVGGVPKTVAQRWIAEHEVHERGWYAGPVGWFDGRGNGDFFVALRSGVLSAERAFLFAGAGIVAGSEPLTEYAETQLKLRGLRAALRC